MDLDDAPAGGAPARRGSRSTIDPVLEEFKALKERIYGECWDAVTSDEGNRQNVFLSDRPYGSWYRAQQSRRDAPPGRTSAPR